MYTSSSSVGTNGSAGSRSTLPGLPESLFVLERPPAGGWGSQAGPVVVLVHGSLDRAGSFRRAARRLDDLGVVTYDRRGYQRSRAGGVSDDFAVHVEDLVRIATACAEHHTAQPGVVAVGHSMGATIALGAAVDVPTLFSAVGAYEPTMPWIEPRRRGSFGTGPDHDVDPGLGAERFFRRIVGDVAWERLTEERRASLRADGPALLADLRALRQGAPFDVTTLAVPALVASGGPASSRHHLETADWLASRVPTAKRSTIAGAGHGAHLSHPEAFASFVREAAALGGGARTRDPD
ncbi:MAG: alpha/beta fold hydrolase [Acidimicrobiales bacterium]